MKITPLFLSFLMLSLCVSSPAWAVPGTDEVSDTLLKEASSEAPLDPTGSAVFGAGTLADREDHAAVLFAVTGQVKILKQGEIEWRSAEKGMKIGEGDKLLTGPEASAEIAYDRFFLNLARIGPNTRAEFLKIEPTIVKLEDGSLLNLLDGLPKGSAYQVTTPTAVAAVRGTHFTLAYSEATQDFFAAALPDPDTAPSAVEITAVRDDDFQGEPILLSEGHQLSCALGEVPSAVQIQVVSPEVVQGAEQTYREMAGHVPDFNKAREEGLRAIEKTGSGELRGPQDPLSGSDNGPGSDANHPEVMRNPVQEESPPYFPMNPDLPKMIQEGVVKDQIMDQNREKIFPPPPPPEHPEEGTEEGGHTIGNP